MPIIRACQNAWAAVRDYLPLSGIESVKGMTGMSMWMVWLSVRNNPAAFNTAFPTSLLKKKFGVSCFLESAMVCEMIFLLLVL